MRTEKVHFTQVKETMLVTLYSRALDYRSKDSILHDKTAEDVVSRIDYDFRRTQVPRSKVFGLMLRAKQLDRWTAAFLAEHPDAVVLHLGCGLDSRVERIDPPESVSWYDVDFPDVIELRQRLYQPRVVYHMIGSSVTDLAFLDQVPSDRPALIVAEGLFMYLSDQKMKDLLQGLTDHFPGGQVAFDVINRLSLWLAKVYPAIVRLGINISWGIDDPRLLEQWVPRLRLVADIAAAETPEIARLPQVTRALTRMTIYIPSGKRPGLDCSRAPTPPRRTQRAPFRCTTLSKSLFARFSVWQICHV